MTTSPSQHVVLCEGYDDRAFLTAIFRLLGMKSMKPLQGEGVSVDAWGEELDKGAFGFASADASKPMMRLRAVNGVTKLGPIARVLLEEHIVKPLASLTLVRDDDGMHDAPAADMEHWLRGILPGKSITKESATTFTVEGIRVHVIAWRSNVPAPIGVPPKQTLERLACTAFAEAHPAHAASVDRWLKDEPASPDRDEPKAYAGSYAAKWFAEERVDQFYAKLFSNEAARDRLCASLAESGAWSVFETLAGRSTP